MEQRRQQSDRRGQGGFTLVEVLVAALLFAIGMVALVAMEFTALGGYAGARDVTQATQFGQRVIQLMRVEGQQWRGDSSPNAISDVNFPFDNDMDGDGTDDFTGGSILSKANDWTWDSVFEQPMDVQMTAQGAQKFCAYVRGETFSGSTGSSAKVQRAQIAVVYPGPSGVIGDSNGDCPDLDSTLKDGIVETEKAGYRVVFVGATIRQRVHLDT